MGLKLLRELSFLNITQILVFGALYFKDSIFSCISGFSPGRVRAFVLFQTFPDIPSYPPLILQFIVIYNISGISFKGFTICVSSLFIVFKFFKNFPVLEVYLRIRELISRASK